MFQISQQRANSSLMAQLADELLPLLAGEMRLDAMTRLLYSTDASNYQIEPLGVVFPRNVEDVIAVHTLAARYGVPLLPRGAGTSLAGQTVGQALVMDFSRYMRGVRAINAEERTVRVQPGTILGHLNAQLAPLGLMVGPDPASADRATVGGCVGNNATGMHSILYGMFGDHVRAVDVVLTDGERLRFGLGAPESARRAALQARVAEIVRANQDEIARRFPKTWRTVAGYALNKIDPATPNLARLFAGAEGTLGTVVEIELGLVPRPKLTRMALLHFETMRAALESVPRILETQPSAVELLDKMLLDMTRAHPDYSRLLTFVEGDPAAILIVEFYGKTDGELTAKIERLRAHMSAGGFAGAMVLAQTDEQIANVLKVRKAGLGLLMSMRGELKPVPFIEDATVPVEHLADYVDGVRAVVRENGARMALYAHASAGCLHIRPLLNLKSEEGLRQYRAIAESVFDLVVGLGGTTSGEHGEGLSRGEFSRKLFGEQITGAFRQLKAAFDPQGLMNPGKVVDVGPMDDPAILRYGPQYATPFVPTTPRLDWSADGGFAGAVEMCNGSGVCRKEGVGVMCPTYMATRDEAQSTRGRANALRAAISGKLGALGLADERLHQVLDWCIACKSCKAECPSLVDMARLKTEALAAYYDRHRVPLRAWVFGHIHRINALGSHVRPLVNAFLRSAVGRWLLGQIGIATQRQMPLLARKRFSTWYKRSYSGCKEREAEYNKENYSHVPILVIDTYTEYNYPHLGQAVAQLVGAGGACLRVWGPPQFTSSGRPLLSKGFLDEAKRLATRNVRRMSPLAARGERFMLIEPSSASIFRDEYPDLVPPELRADAERLAEAILTVEEWLAEAAEEGLLKAENFDQTPAEVLLHGHCHQRALWGTGATHRALALLLPRCTVSEPDDGCCGVAGSFGFEAEHYELSMQIGELRFLSAVRQAPDAVVLASGVSCREQAAHGADRQALHPVEFLASRLRK